MDLLLWRHAEAEDAMPDAGRRLTPRGEKHARQVADWILARAPARLRIVASPATRCQQTAQALGRAFETDARLALAGDASGLLAAAGWPHGNGDKAGAVLLVGHQPTLGQTAALLLAGAEADWTIKKGALWWFTNRTRRGETQTVLKAVIAPEIV